MSEVVALLVGAYGAGRVDLPQLQLVYPTSIETTAAAPVPVSENAGE
jgi:hypothetical protein